MSFANYHRRLQATCAKIQQGLPEEKRDGNEVMLAYAQDLLCNDSSTSKAVALLTQMKVNPELLERLRTEPAKVKADFEEFRRHCELRTAHATSILHWFPVSDGPYGLEILRRW